MGSDPCSDRQPLLSVVVNTYNRLELLPRALDSVLSQDRSGVEIVVADDGSTEPVEQLLSERFAGVHYVRQDNAGLSASRNLGARHSNGRFVLFLDDDDELLPGAIESFLHLLAKDGIGIASGGAEVMAPGGARQHVRPRPLGPAMGDVVATFLPGSFAIRRDVFDDIGGFDEELQCSHQTELFMRAGPRCIELGLQVVATSSPVLRQHRDVASARKRNDPERLYQATMRILERHGDRLRLAPSTYADYLGIAGVAAIRAGNLREGRNLLWRAARAHPRDKKRLARGAISFIPPLARRVWH